MTKLRMGIAAFALIASVSIAIGQGQGLWPNFPIVGSSSYCASTTNGVCTSTIPAGPTALTGSESIPANTNLSGGRSPQNVLITPASLNALPMNWVTGGVAANQSISASALTGGAFIISSSTISVANLTLPLGAIDGQEYTFSANRSILALSVTAPAGDTLGTSAGPTALTASTTISFGYRWKYHGSTKVWQRLQ